MCQRGMQERIDVMKKVMAVMLLMGALLVAGCMSTGGRDHGQASGSASSSSSCH